MGLLRSTDDGAGDDEPDPLREEIEEAEAEGWTVAKERDDWALLKRPHWGRKRWHLVFLLTLGLGNVLYAPYKRFIRPDKKLVGDPPGRIRRKLTKGNILKWSVKAALRAIGN